MRKINLILLTILLSIIVFLSKPRHVYAIQTILGDIPNKPEDLAGWFLEHSILVAGGIAFLLMIYGGFLFMTSAGDPNKLQEATDVIMSAIAGLLMIIFSVFLLRLIGVTFLGL